jgi:hypothetical protein
MAKKIHGEAASHSFDASSAKSAGFFMLITLMAMAVGILAAVAT